MTFHEWYDENLQRLVKGTLYDALQEAWTAAQQSERERCREIVITMGGPEVPDLLRQIDSGEE